MKTIFKGNHSLMTIKFVLMAIIFGDLELLLILNVTLGHFKHFSQSNQMSDRLTHLIQFCSV